MFFEITNYVLGVAIQYYIRTTSKNVHFLSK